MDDPRLRYPAFLASQALAGTAWWALAHLCRHRSLPPRFLALATVVVLGARAWALALPPAFSEDAFRYLYEGRVFWVMGPSFAFLHPPADALAAGVPPALLDAAWLRINHAHVPTIYPPLSQLCFAVGAGLGDLDWVPAITALKAVLVLADLLIFALLARSRGLATGLVYAACPLAVLEVAREGHGDVLAALGLAAGAVGFLSQRPGRGFAGFALAALGKLNGLIGFAAGLRTTRRGALPGALLLALLGLPLLLAGPGALSGASAYAGAWRAGDGAFSLLLGLAEAMLGGDWARVGALTLTRHQLARGLTALCFVACAVWVLRRRGDEPEVAGRAGLLMLLLLLLSPTLHPWYALWVLPFVALGLPDTRAAMALLLLAPLLHHPGWVELETGRWTDAAWVRALVHVPVWLVLARDLARRRAFR